MYSYLKFSIQEYHRPIPHTKFIHFNITRTKTSCTVAYCMAYSLEWTESLRLSSTLHALPPQRQPKLNSADLHQSQEHPLEKVGWTCPPQFTPWRRSWLSQTATDRQTDRQTDTLITILCTPTWREIIMHLSKPLKNRVKFELTELSVSHS